MDSERITLDFLTLETLFCRAAGLSWVEVVDVIFVFGRFLSEDVLLEVIRVEEQLSLTSF